jgi:hypothetical protein
MNKVLLPSSDETSAVGYMNQETSFGARSQLA